jgi:hypothetical protein
MTLFQYDRKNAKGKPQRHVKRWPLSLKKCVTNSFHFQFLSFEWKSLLIYYGKFRPSPYVRQLEAAADCKLFVFLFLVYRLDFGHR